MDSLKDGSDIFGNCVCTLRGKKSAVRRRDFFGTYDKEKMSAWQKCEAPLDDTPSSPAPEAAQLNKYAMSRCTTIAVLLILWLVRPPFVCNRSQLRVGAALAVAIVAGLLVLGAPWLKRGASMMMESSKR